MAPISAFALGPAVSSFASSSVYSSTTPLRPIARRAGFSVRDEARPSLNPRLTPTAQAQYGDPQPGEPGYSARKASKKSSSKSGGDDDDPSVVSDAKDYFEDVAGAASRGFKLLRDDLLKSAPERFGIGRQDTSSLAEPSYGEPGYKPPEDDSVPFRKPATGAKISEPKVDMQFPQSTFTSQPRASFKVSGASQSTPPAKPSSSSSKDSSGEYDLPDYLKPLPEDTPRSTWKNYDGR